MAERVACLSNGKLVLVQAGQELAEIESPYAEQIAARERALLHKNASKTGRRAALMDGGRATAWGASAAQDLPPARVVGVTRGRVSGELCYAISTGVASGIFAQKPGTRDEQRLFHNADVQIAQIDFSFAEEAFTCTVDGARGTSAIGILADDGKGVRTVTEGDVLDRGPRWVPGGVGEIVYASAGIGRTRSGAWASRAPFSLHRLRMNDSTVEVLVSDAKYDYVAPIPASASSIYAIRRQYEETKPSAARFGALPARLLAPFRRLSAARHEAAAGRMMVWGSMVEVTQDSDGATHSAEKHETAGYELVRITPKGSEVIAQGVIAFDLAPGGDIVYSNGRALYRAAPAKGSKPTLVAQIVRVEQIVIC